MGQLIKMEQIPYAEWLYPSSSHFLAAAAVCYFWVCWSKGFTLQQGSGSRESRGRLSETVKPGL